MKKINPVREIEFQGQKLTVDFSDFLKVWKQIEEKYKKSLGKNIFKKCGGK